jgi:hypothetical protein
MQNHPKSEPSTSGPTKPSERQYPVLSPEAKDRVLTETKKLLTDHRTAPVSQEQEQITGGLLN